ncbi:MAG: hypothetical protein SPK23_07380 [Eubacteriales bacterium]|nr:hypothetical protein [Clostridiales bacterium]MDY5836913.1 hypothetical protein [Eubacteriales bacterium]
MIRLHPKVPKQAGHRQDPDVLKVMGKDLSGHKTLGPVGLKWEATGLIQDPDKAKLDRPCRRVLAQVNAPSLALDRKLALGPKVLVAPKGPLVQTIVLCLLLECRVVLPLPLILVPRFGVGLGKMLMQREKKQALNKGLRIGKAAYPAGS